MGDRATGPLTEAARDAQRQVFEFSWNLVVASVGKAGRSGKPAVPVAWIRVGFRSMSKFSFEKFADRIRRRRIIKNPIASDTWIYNDASGKKRKARITVAKPRPIPKDPDRTWYCAVRVTGWRRDVIPAFGIGPLDSLANGLQVVRSFQDEIGTSHIIAQAGKRFRTRHNAVPLDPQLRRSVRR